MLPLPKALASPRNTQIPAPGQQDGAPEPPNPGDTEACRLRFRQFQYRVAGGPHHALGHLWMLLRQWLRPEAHSKEQIMELLVLEQFLGALPSKMRTWVQSQGPRTCKEAATLVEDLIEMSQQEVLVSLTEHQDKSNREEEEGMSPKSRKDPSQASELGLPQEGEWLQPSQPQRSPHARAGAEASCTLGSLGLQPPSMQTDGPKTLQHEVPSASHPGPGCLLPKPSIWDEPPCGPAGDGALRNRHSLPRQAQDAARAEGSAWQAEAAPRDTALQGTGGQGPALEGPLHPSPQPGWVADPTLPSAQSGSPQKGLGDSDASGTHLPLLKDPKASPEEAGQPLAAAPSSGSSAAPQVPPGARPFTCAECGEVFIWVTHFIEHQKRHLEEGPFSCPDCGKAFLHASVLEEHRKIHLLQPPRKRPRRARGEGPGEARRLEAAGRGPRARNANGGRRRESSSRERPFECGVCGKAFPWMVHLLDHQKLHATQ
ncbi:zinc finger and SCAN domain-containing protein 1 [Enhydra lutris kenyoni]|uniref:Zinc finger and SCAN domain-containing protein 1 n=1 Tax=Enhydra lutris kenyoni TaxID=391180 RepID=A0A2Y9IL06_ENHLU|nr:zinc finger and SCAN domain-containing protein 1 [Enhydra lutris kenyoni]